MLHLLAFFLLRLALPSDVGITFEVIVVVTGLVRIGSCNVSLGSRATRLATVG